MVGEETFRLKRIRRVRSLVAANREKKTLNNIRKTGIAKRSRDSSDSYTSLASTDGTSSSITLDYKTPLLSIDSLLSRENQQPAQDVVVPTGPEKNQAPINVQQQKGCESLVQQYNRLLLDLMQQTSASFQNAFPVSAGVPYEQTTAELARYLSNHTVSCINCSSEG